MEDFRIEKDTMGDVKVPSNVLWGAQTQRSINNFKIGRPGSMPLEIIYGFAYLKKAAAFSNCELGGLPEVKRDLIAAVCDEILDGKHPSYQTYKLKNRMLKEGILVNICSECGISEWNGKSISLELDHVDGVRTNHKLENLRLLCPNCHSQTDTYRSKNRI